MEYLSNRKDVEEKRARVTAKPKAEGRIDHPRSADVVLGRGRPFQEFPGNVRLAFLIEQQRQVYQALDRLNKTALSLEIVKLVKNTGGRFLKRCEDDIGGWIEVADDVARDKVSHGFRTKTKRKSQSSPDQP
jgi:hypothetical protein